MVVLVLDHVVADLGPIKNRAGGDVGGWVFDDFKDTLDGDAATGSGGDTELGDADEPAEDDHVTGGDVGFRNERDRHALVDVDRPDGCDDWIAHGGSSLAQANANEVVGGGCIGHDLAQVKRASVDLGDDAVVGRVDLLPGGVDFGVSGILRDVEDTLNGDRAEHVGLEIAFGDANEVALDDDRANRDINVGSEVDVLAVVNVLSLHGIESGVLSLEEECNTSG